MSNEQYEKRVMVWLDVLGFGSYINQNSAEEVRKIYRLFEDSEEFLRRTNLTTLPVDFTQWRYHYISDTIAISCPYSKNDFHVLIHMTMFFQLQILSKYNLFCRGALVYDDIYDPEKHVIYGPGVLTANKIEKYIAKWPNIVLDESALSVATPSELCDLLRFEKGSLFIDYLNDFFHLLAYMKDSRHLIYNVEEPISLLTMHKQKIADSVNTINDREEYSTKDRQHILYKYKLIVRYHNKVIRDHISVINWLLRSSNNLKKMFDDSIGLKEPTMVIHSPLWGIICLLINNVFPGLKQQDQQILFRDFRVPTISYLKSLKYEFEKLLIKIAIVHVPGNYLKLILDSRL